MPIIITILALAAFFSFDNPLKYKINKNIWKASVKEATKANLASDLAIGITTKTAQFDKEGIDDIALITMIKDEDDIIYENLVWHFCVGFRKFIIVDNNSTDKTRILIEKFRKETASIATVIIVDDPIVEYIQSKVTTGAMLMASSIWPEVTWVFPVDADEFWYPYVRLKEILSKIPDDKDVILTSQYQHVPVQDAENFNQQIPFYDSLNFRLKSLPGGLGKIAVRFKSDVVIAQGNHSARSTNYNRNMGYISGNKIGLDMRHFAMRSVAQVEKKYWNGAKANILGQKLGVLPHHAGTHWTAFMHEVKDKGIKQASIDRFNNSVQSKDECIEDPLPMR